MRKLLLVLAGCYIYGTSYADIGSIRVKSYLSQNLNAQIPITGQYTDEDYTNLAIGLADGSKFKTYGIRYNPELGYLLFKVVNGSNGHYLQITSSRPINSPVLTFLLHYKLNSDDFYRQYTVLLDPVDYSNNAPIASSQRATTVTYHTTQKPIPISTHRVAKVASTNSKPQLSFESDFSSSFVRAHLANFNQDSFSYTTSEGDNLYLIARFEQMLYPKAGLEINQILIGLGLENYDDLYPPNDLYESGAEIFLPKPQAVKQISSILADAYLWDYALISDQKMNMLRDMAAKFDSELVIESSILFAGSRIKDVASSPVASAPVKYTPVAPPTPPKAVWLELLQEYKYQLIGGILGMLLLIGLGKKFKTKTSKNGELVLDSSLEPKSGLFGFLQRKPQSEELTVPKFEHDFDDGITINSITNNVTTPLSGAAATITATPKTALEEDSSHTEKPAFEPPPLPTQDSGVAVQSLNSVDTELINTLEQILAFDDARDDIRYKLLELYLASGIKDKSQAVYSVLDQRLDNDDPLRGNIADACTRFAFKPEINLAMSDKNAGLHASSAKSASGQSDYNEYSTEQTPLEFSVASASATDPLPTVDEVVNNANLAETQERVVDFQPLATSSIDEPADTPAKIDEDAESVDFSNERIVDFATFSQAVPIEEPKSVTVNHDFNLNQINDYSVDSFATGESESAESELNDESDEQLNLARMYYHIDEHSKAYELLSTLINDPQSSENSKQQAKQLITDLGLHG